MNEQSIVDFWGREPDFICHQTDEEIPHVDVYRFPVSEDKECAMSYRNVYMTSGMSAREMDVPKELENQIPLRVELTAYAEDIVMMENQSMDFVSYILHWMSHFPFKEKTFFSYFQTLQIGHPLIAGSEMSAYLFAQTPIVSAIDLFASFPNVDGVIHVMPISEAERMLIINEGAERLFEVFHEHCICPDFDLFRKSVV